MFQLLVEKVTDFWALHMSCINFLAEIFYLKLDSMNSFEKRLDWAKSLLRSCVFVSRDSTRHISFFGCCSWSLVCFLTKRCCQMTVFLRWELRILCILLSFYWLWFFIVITWEDHVFFVFFLFFLVVFRFSFPIKVLS